MRLSHGTPHPSLTNHCDSKLARATSRPQPQFSCPISGLRVQRWAGVTGGPGMWHKGLAWRGGELYTTKFSASTPALVSLLPPLGGPAPAYMLAGQTLLHRRVSHGDRMATCWDGMAGPWLFSRATRPVGHQVWLWWGQWEPEATPAPTGPGLDSGSAVSGVFMHGTQGRPQAAAIPPHALERERRLSATGALGRTTCTTACQAGRVQSKRAAPAPQWWNREEGAGCREGTSAGIFLARGRGLAWARGELRKSD